MPQTPNLVGEPVAEWRKPDVGNTYSGPYPANLRKISILKHLGLQWQWHANPPPVNGSHWQSTRPVEALRGTKFDPRRKLMVLFRIYYCKNFPHRLLQQRQKFLSSFRQQVGDRSGLLVMGQEWAFIAMTKAEEGLKLGTYIGTYDRGVWQDAGESKAIPLRQDSCYLRVQVNSDAVCRFYYSSDGKTFKQLVNYFTARKGMWIGAKIGLFCINPNITASKGYADFDFF